MPTGSLNARGFCPGKAPSAGTCRLLRFPFAAAMIPCFLTYYVVLTARINDQVVLFSPVLSCFFPLAIVFPSLWVFLWYDSLYIRLSWVS